MKAYFVYIMTNSRNTVLYTGVTGWLESRVHDHREQRYEGFTKRYHVNKLVFALEFSNARTAIRAEKTIKGWTRKKKITLINSVNPEWKDLMAEDGFANSETLRSFAEQRFRDGAPRTASLRGRQGDGLLGKLLSLEKEYE